MIYVQNHKILSGRQVGKWHKVGNGQYKMPESGEFKEYSDCGRHRLKKKDKYTSFKPRNLTPVNSCGKCFGPKDWIKQ